MPPPTALAVSFGHIYGPPPEADLIVDVRGWVPADPGVTAWCRPLTGADAAVRDTVLNTDGASQLLAHLQGAAEALLRVQPGRTPTIAIGCSGGRHRSVVLADELAARLRFAGIDARAKHRHVDRRLP